MIGSRFDTKEDLYKALKEYYIERGVIICIDKSDYKKNKIIFKCDRGGTYKDKHNHRVGGIQRNTTTRKVDCKFKIFTSLKDKKWIVNRVEGSHNHDLDNSLLGHPGFRTLDGGEKEKIKYLSESGVPPRKILTVLQKDHGDTKDIYNQI